MKTCKRGHVHDHSYCKRCNALRTANARGGYVVRKTAAERFWAKVRKTATCWLWRGATNKSGYGNFWDGERNVSAHRFAFGEVPEGLEIDHLCSVRNCVNPDHMEAVTHAENVRRSSRWKAVA